MAQVSMTDQSESPWLLSATAGLRVRATDGDVHVQMADDNIGTRWAYVPDLRGKPAVFYCRVLGSIATDIGKYYRMVGVGDFATANLEEV
jgi:hypothetical protein